MKTSPEIIRNHIKAQALLYNDFGEPASVLRMHYVSKSPLKPGEILVKMKQSCMNPSDLIPIRGTYKNRIKLPCVPGYEGFGYVVEHGQDVSSPPIGTKVLAIRGEGTWQDYVVILAEDAIIVPDSINDDTAAQLYINPMTAWLMIKEKLKLKAGDTIALNAAGGAFGNVIAKFSKIFGYDFIAIVRNEFYRNTLLASGAKYVINTEKLSVSLMEEVLDITNGSGVAVALDAVGGESGVALAKCVKPSGTMLHYGLLSGVPLPPEAFHSHLTGITVENFWFRRMLLEMGRQGFKKAFVEMIEAFVQYNITLSVAERFDISDISKAVKSAEKPNREGKTALIWDNVLSCIYV